MLRARLSNGDFVMGVDDENIRRLTAGQPLLINLRQMGGRDKVLIVHGHTLDDIRRELAQVSGAPLPPETPLPPDIDKEPQQ